MADYTILVIDYEPRSIERLRVPLERAGYRVEVATDGQSGIRRFHALRPAVVIIEAMLPKRHGFEVCKELKQTPHGKACSVMIATAVYRGLKYRHQAMHLYGCDAYLEKPLADQDLLSVVEESLQKYAGERRKVTEQAFEIDTTLLSEEPPAGARPTAPARSAAPLPSHAPVGELDILDRLDTLLSDDPSKDSPTRR